MPDTENGKQNTQNAKVLKLGLNISVSGDPGTDFEIVLDDKEKAYSQLPSPNEDLKHLEALDTRNAKTNLPKHETEKVNNEEVKAKGAIPKHKKSNSTELLKSSDLEMGDNSVSKESSIISKIKSTMEQFEKFSDHIKEIPRLRNCPIATSTPFSDKYNSKSESSLMYQEFKLKKYSHSNDIHSRKDYFKNYGKPPDLFLKPLPAEGYYKRGIYSRYIDLEPFRHYDSDFISNKGTEHRSAYVKSGYDFDKYEESYIPSESLPGILKKSDSESGDKQSTSSAESVKDIKIYQSGGILIMQNFKDNMDATEKKEISEFSAKLIENCNKLKMEVGNFQEDKPAVGNSSDENKNFGKMVQFDLSSVEGQKSKSADSSCNALKDESSSKMESSESTSDCVKNKDASPPGTSQSQDFPSLSTQENDSMLSNQPGMSPTCTSSRKLEWDSGADIGYLNLDLTKENLSTIEKIVLKGLSSDGLSEKNVVFEKSEQNQTNRSKFILERRASDLAVEEMGRTATKSKNIDSHDKSFIEKNNGKNDSEIEKQVLAGGNFKGENRTKLEETKSNRSKNSSKEVFLTGRCEILPAENLETSDKSVNVNTLFLNASQQTPAIEVFSKELNKLVESPVKPKHRKLPKVSLSKNKKPFSQRLRTPKKSLSAPNTPNLLSGALGTFEMGVPKKVYKKVEANPTINDIELSREVDEIIIDQRFKIKAEKELEVPIKNHSDNANEVKNKSRPISASSSSNNTVLPKSGKKDDVEEKIKTLEQKLSSDQIIQTSDYDCQSVGVQAFSSQVSSDCDVKSFRKTKTMNSINRECVNTSSKNIQVFGLNASLPKQLEHPKETEIFDKQHTKSTQFFGGPLNSLPNYHSNLVTKPVESCGRAPNILKIKKNSETEIIRLREENEKNILANDAPKMAEPKKDCKRQNIENKENIISQKSTNSRRSQSNASRKDSVKNDQTKSKKNSLSVEGSDCPHTSDEVSSMVLTSEVLKEHCDSIDRNIIQEKYFQSQLVELEKRKMISRSTSMEIQQELESRGNVKEYMTTGCQYSLQSRETTSGAHYQEPDDGSFKDDPSRSQFETLKDTNRGPNLGAGDSLPSSTQTAHSWIPGVQNIRENTTGVGRARSFEYLPGHIYESSGNLREELPSETEQNLITSCSDSDTAKVSVSESGNKDSEGRNTLILENSTCNSQDSDRLKILDENLTQLNFALLKLRKKDAQVYSVTKALLADLWKKMGVGDSLLLAAADTSKSEPKSKKDSPDYEKEANTLSEISTQELKKDTKEFSIACQTEPKSQFSESEKFFEQKKVLEKRISEEKKCQIKWIENEIHHLNILRELLEQRNSSIQRKKKHSFLTLNDNKNEENHPKNTSQEICPPAVTPVYGCTISISEKSNTASEEHNAPVRKQECSPQYGMTVSLSGKSNNWQRFVMLPVDLQVSLKDINLLKEGNEEEQKDDQQCSHRKHSSKSDEPSVSRERKLHSEMCTQYPSTRSASNNGPTPSQTEIPSPKKSSRCNHDNCMCINLSGNSFPSFSNSSRSKSIDQGKLRFQNNDVDLKNRKRSTAESLEMPDSFKFKTLSSQQIPRMSGTSEPSGSCFKHSSTQSTSCKCQNCSKQLPVSKSALTSENCSQPNIQLEKTNNFHYSKVQLHKSSNCGCHVIKIHGARCCSSERNSCSCRCRNAAKKTENQSCQTDCSASQKSKETRISKRDRGTSIPENSFSDTVLAEEKLHPKSAPDCSCRKKTEEHPRHYFLKIEETEVDEIDKPTQEKKSLEVITVTIPVKKAGKSKIYDTGVQGIRDQCPPPPKLPPKECNCCGSCQTASRDYKRNVNYSYLRSRAEEPEPRIENHKVSRQENNYYEDFYSSEQPEKYSFSEQCYQNAGNDEFEEEVPVPDNHAYQCCEGCHCIHQREAEIQKEYDSHKRQKRSKEKYEDGNQFYENIREHRNMSQNIGRQYETGGNDWDSGLEACRNQQFNGEAYSVNPEYYNYNKREFMTKSEIRKEEEQKQKVHQPSLQQYLCSNRPDFYNSAERRREIISERSKERLKRKNNRMECLMKMLNQCNEKERSTKEEPKRIFTSEQMRMQTLKRYKKLPEVTGKIADQKKKQECRTNRLLADVFAKKLQIEVLKGHLNLSNSVSVLNTI